PLTGEGANDERAVGHLDSLEIGKAVEIDDDAGGGEAQVEHRHEALPPGQWTRLVAVFGQEAHGLGQRPWPFVPERRRFHRRVACARAQTRAGVRGSSTSISAERASRPRASATALATAAGAVIVVPSPRPLAPSGVTGDGDSTIAAVGRG